MKSHFVTITGWLLATYAWAQDPTPKAAVAPAKSPARRVTVSTDFDVQAGFGRRADWMLP